MTRPAFHRSAALAAVALSLAIAQAAEAGPPKKAFTTPEAAVEHFVRSVAADDFDGAMEAFAIDDYATHFDFARQARDMGLFTATHSDAPSRYKMYVRTNALKALRDAANQTMTFAAKFLVDESALERFRDDPSNANATAFVQAMDLTKLRALKIVRIDQPRKSVTSQPKWLELLKSQAAAQGADDSTERIALFRLAGQHYWCGFRLYKYGNTWRIRDLKSFLASEKGDTLLGVEKTTPKEFEAHTK